MRWTLSMIVAVALCWPTLASARKSINWYTSATAYKGKKGKTIKLRCKGGGTAGGTLFGTKVYTTDSLICLAAVHAGMITLAGGKVDIRIIGGKKKYKGSTRHGVKSSSWGSYPASFKFVGKPSKDVAKAAKVGAPTISWSQNAWPYQGKVGSKHKFYCPGGGKTGGTVYGSGPYTTDSKICVAAVHAGKIKASKGGKVKIKILAGKKKYKGSTRNGVTTRSWGSYPKSFKFK